MYSIRTSAILFIYFSVFAFETVFAAENGYIIEEEIPCEEPTASVLSESCSGFIDYKVPNKTKVPIGWRMQSLLSIADSNIPNATSLVGNQQCHKSGKKYLCEAANPFRCEEEYIRIDTINLTTTCYQMRESCSSTDAVLLNKFFGCSKIYYYGFNTGRRKFSRKISRKFTCVDFPVLIGDPYTCNYTNYKVFARSRSSLCRAAETVESDHKALESSTADKECKEKVAEAICKAPLPACSSDHTKIIALLSKEKCREMVGCVNKTNDAMLIKQAHEMCDSQPSEKTAKKYSLDNVFDGKAPSNAMAFGTIFFFVFLVAQLVF